MTPFWKAYSPAQMVRTGALNGVWVIGFVIGFVTAFWGQLTAPTGPTDEIKSTSEEPTADKPEA